MRYYGFFNELGFNKDTTIDNYRKNKLIIKKEVLLKFLREEGNEWHLLRVVKNPITKENYYPVMKSLKDIKWCNYLIDLIEIGIYPPEEFQQYIADYYK